MHVLMIEHWYLVCMFIVTSPFLVPCGDFVLTFDLSQGQICCREGDKSSWHLFVSNHLYEIKDFSYRGYIKRMCLLKDHYSISQFNNFSQFMLDPVILSHAIIRKLWKIYDIKDSKNKYAYISTQCLVFFQRWIIHVNSKERARD